MAKPQVDEKDLATRYGFALSMLNSDPSLKKLFNRAVAHTYTPARFIAELRQTKWFRQNSEAMRNAQVLKKTDPATWEAKKKETIASIKDMAAQLGGQVSSAALSHIAHNVLTFGLNDAQIRDTLAQTIKLSGGTYGGQAAVNADTLQKMAYNNGVQIGKDQLNGWLQRIGAGEDISGFQQYVTKMAMTAFPGFTKELSQGGLSVRDLADPYINSMAQTLELNANDLNLFDPTIRSALSARDAEGKIGMKPLYQFETELRKDPRWLGTKNSQDTLNSIGHGLLQSFGLMT